MVLLCLVSFLAAAVAVPVFSVMDAKNSTYVPEIYSPSNFTQFDVKPATIKVSTLADAIRKASDPAENHHNVVYEVTATGELFFQVDPQFESPQGSPKQEVPADDGTAVLPQLHQTGILDKAGIWDKADNVFDSVGSVIDRTKNKIGVNHDFATDKAPLAGVASKWVAQKIEIIETKLVPGLMPVTPCLDSTFGTGGGSISFSHGTTITSDTKMESTLKLGYLIYVQLKRTETDSLSTSFSHTVAGTIPAGEKGQIFINSPTIVSTIVSQTGYSFGQTVYRGEQTSTQVDALDYGSPFEYHLLTSDKHGLSCGSKLQVEVQ